MVAIIVRSHYTRFRPPFLTRASQTCFYAHQNEIFTQYRYISSSRLTPNNPCFGVGGEIINYVKKYFRLPQQHVRVGNSERFNKEMDSRGTTCTYVLWLFKTKTTFGLLQDNYHTAYDQKHRVNKSQVEVSRWKCKEGLSRNKETSLNKDSLSTFAN